jgi:XTP/dITP diphosphohydrolase
VGHLAAFASGNENKLRELQHALPGWEIQLLGAQEYPPETGTTYYENALAKARFGRNLTDSSRWVLGEDSGVEIEGLDGGPGILSARWASGREADRALEELAGVEGAGRRARYVCELVAISPEGVEHRGTGVLQGRIANEAAGSEGFGFDPVFVPEGEERTVAQLGNEWKREHSHRARAAHDLLASIMLS